MDMACIDPTLKSIWQERYNKYVSLLASAYDYYDAILLGEGLDSFKFDSGEAMSWAKYTDPDKFLKVLRGIESQVDHYRNKLRGTGIVRLNLRRKGGRGLRV